MKTKTRSFNLHFSSFYRLLCCHHAHLHPPSCLLPALGEEHTVQIHPEDISKSKYVQDAHIYAIAIQVFHFIFQAYQGLLGAYGGLVPRISFQSLV